MDFGWYGDEDVAGAVSFLVEQRDVDPERIGAVGMSMGGEEAIGAAAADSRIRGVLACPATESAGRGVRPVPVESSCSFAICSSQPRDPRER